MTTHSDIHNEEKYNIQIAEDSFQISAYSHTSQQIIKQGYLVKTSQFIKANRKRWIVLRGIYLYCYRENNIDSNPTEIFDLTQYNKTKPIKNKSGLSQFALISSSTIFSKRLFIASSDNEMNDWIFHINLVQSSNIKIKIKTEKTDNTSILSGVQKFNILCNYNSSISLLDIITASIQYLEDKYHPKRYMLHEIGDDSFVSHSDLPIDINVLHNYPITLWKHEEIHKDGLHLFIKNTYHHKICNVNITCKYMMDINSNDPYDCPIYNSMKNMYVFNKENLWHLNDFNHFKDEYSEKSECKHGQECFAYIRLENGGNQLKDLCHAKLFRHPPRSDRNIKLQDNIHKFLVNQRNGDNASLHYENHYDFGGFLDGRQPYTIGSTTAKLIDEVKRNGFESDLCLTDEDEKNHEYSIMKIVDEKLKCSRHKAVGSPLSKSEMLALILYTGCDCNYDLCASQRNGNYKKWKCFDYCLFWAIYKLHKCEKGKYKLYSGLNGVKLNEKEMNNCYFKTYVSATWIREVALTFAGDTGMIVEIEEHGRNDMICCDVSWISRFPDECEVLIARSTCFFSQAFECRILDEISQIQTISIINKFDRNTRIKAEDKYYEFMNEKGTVTTLDKDEYSAMVMWGFY